MHWTTCILDVNNVEKSMAWPFWGQWCCIKHQCYAVLCQFPLRHVLSQFEFQASVWWLQCILHCASTWKHILPFRKTDSNHVMGPHEIHARIIWITENPFNSSHSRTFLSKQTFQSSTKWRSPSFNSWADFSGFHIIWTCCAAVYSITVILERKKGIILPSGPSYFISSILPIYIHVVIPSEFPGFNPKDSVNSNVLADRVPLPCHLRALSLCFILGR